MCCLENGSSPRKCHLNARAEGNTESERGRGGLGKVLDSPCGSVVSVQVLRVLAGTWQHLMLSHTRQALHLQLLPAVRVLLVSLAADAVWSLVLPVHPSNSWWEWQLLDPGQGQLHPKEYLSSSSLRIFLLEDFPLPRPRGAVGAET